jgi:(1->4)-alpha-D-glucan 1-alpha-D-glucosylmutase
VDGDPAYEEAVQRWCLAILEDDEIGRHIDSWVALTALETRANILGQKLIQLLMPGVPDVYQGTELVDLSLVDPDNRRPVDYTERESRLDRLDGGGAATDVGDEKLQVVAAAVRLRTERAEVFVGECAGYLPLPASSDNLIAFSRGNGGPDDVVVLATRLAGQLADGGGWGDHTLELPGSSWRDLLSGRSNGGGTVRIADVLRGDGSPVAILVRGGE